MVWSTGETITAARLEDKADKDAANGYAGLDASAKIPIANLDVDIATQSELDNHTALTTHLPSGAILMWHGLIAAIPTGYILCDGTSGTPDLRSRFIRGAPASTEAGGTGGADTHTLSENEMPTHTHNMSRGTGATYNYNVNSSSGSGGVTATTATGGGAAHNNMPAYYQILFIMKT
jgi:hypothetical protein